LVSEVSTLKYRVGYCVMKPGA